MSKTKNRRQKAGVTLAQDLDRYDLYLRSVQEPAHEVEFFDKVYCERHGGPPLTLREDFCGTFAVCCEWVRSHPNRRAIGVDLDPEPLDWGRRHNLALLPVEARQRVECKKVDVRTVARIKSDILAAQNFSFWIFKTRSELLGYFKKAYANISDGGIMVLDMMGGWECYEQMDDVRKIEADGPGKPGFKYVWEQVGYNPVNHDASFYIHFRFHDGSEQHRAFEYHWRFWTIPEVRELLDEAGFSGTGVYWEGEDENGEGDGQWQRVESAKSDPSWIAYIVAFK